MKVEFHPQAVEDLTNMLREQGFSDEEIHEEIESIKTHLESLSEEELMEQSISVEDDDEIAEVIGSRLANGSSTIH